MRSIIILRNSLPQGIIKAASIDRSIRVWAKVQRTDLFVSISHDGLNVTFSLGCFSAPLCWRLQDLVRKGGPIFPKKLFMFYQRWDKEQPDLGMVAVTIITDLSL